MSRRMSQCFLLILFGIITGSFSVPWNMTVSPLVSVWRGEDAVLSCSFTHPRQQDYSGKITVKWGARDSKSEPFLQCSVKNDSTGGLGDCSIPGLRYSLDGNPRQGVLSLLIRTVQLSDNGAYYCRVELDWQRWSSSAFEKETNLQVTVKPQILNFSVVEVNSSSDSATRRLQCEVEGNPLPTITWLSGSTPLSADQVQTSESSPYQVTSSVPYPEEQPVFTCRAESVLGVAERRYPASKTLLITLTVCGIIVLLLLTGFIIYCLKLRARTETPPEYGNTDRVEADVSPVYENNEVVENHRLQCSEGPAGGGVEPQLYYAVTLHCSPSSQHASFQNSTQPHEDTGIVYSLLNDQQ
ncbi:sialic acid-binding Ig-like lectin 15 [Scomber scombrus]|uniref:Sialic acid-binding Ig-like lectin 15 n=1 Tax=Scomber scombrus TaxID=13677 RepID=A0AAV1QEM3_SCOSC